MRKICFLVIMVLSHIAVYAQRGKIRPEWDICYGNRSSHNLDNDLWSFLFIIGIIIIAFACTYLYGVVKRGKREK